MGAFAGRKRRELRTAALKQRFPNWEAPGQSGLAADWLLPLVPAAGDSASPSPQAGNSADPEASLGATALKRLSHMQREN